MNELLTAEQFAEIEQHVARADDDPEWGFLVPEVRLLLKHIETQRQIIAAAISSLKPFIENNPTDEQVMTYLQEYAHLIMTVPPASPPVTPEELEFWQSPKFDN